MAYKATVTIEVAGLHDQEFARTVALALTDVAQTIVSLPGFPGVVAVVGKAEEESE